VHPLAGGLQRKGYKVGVKAEAVIASPSPLCSPSPLFAKTREILSLTATYSILPTYYFLQSICIYFQ